MLLDWLTIRAYKNVMERIDPAAEFEGGNSALAEGRASDAVRHYRRALRVAPDVAEVHHNLAAALARLSWREEAVVSARRDLASRPDFARCRWCWQIC